MKLLPYTEASEPEQSLYAWVEHALPRWTKGFPVTGPSA